MVIYFSSVISANKLQICVSVTSSIFCTLHSCSRYFIKNTILILRVLRRTKLLAPFFVDEATLKPFSISVRYFRKTWAFCGLMWGICVAVFAFHLEYFSLFLYGSILTDRVAEVAFKLLSEMKGCNLLYPFEWTSPLILFESLFTIGVSCDGGSF